MGSERRKCLDGPNKGAIYILPAGRGTGFIHKRKGTGRYLPVGESGLSFEYWRRCTDEEAEVIRNGENTST